MTLVLVILIVLLLLGGGWGYSSGHVAYNNPIGIILTVLVVVLLVGLFLPYAGYHWYP